MISNTKEDIVRLSISAGEVGDRTPVFGMTRGITAKLIGDKAYISKDLFAKLFQQASQLITRIKKNMENYLMKTADKLMLMKRSFIEAIFSSLKALNTLIHHRHRCPLNAFVHLFAGLINYQLRQDKPSLHNLTQINPYTQFG